MSGERKEEVRSDKVDRKGEGKMKKKLMTVEDN